MYFETGADCLRGMMSPGNIVSGHVVSGADCLRGMLSPGADCLWGRLSWGTLSRGILSQGTLSQGTMSLHRFVVGNENFKYFSLCLYIHYMVSMQLADILFLGDFSQVTARSKLQLL